MSQLVVTSSKALIAPTIHLNGTSPDRLIEALCEAADKLNTAYDAIKETAPNGRDYYPQGPGALQAASEQHMDRLRRVDDVRKELESLAQAVDLGRL